MISRKIHLILIFSAFSLSATILAFSPPFLPLSYGQQSNLQDTCPFYLPNCNVVDQVFTTQATSEPNMTVILNTATISVHERNTHYDILTEKFNGTWSEISNKIMAQVRDIERNEDSLFVVDRISNETIQPSDFDTLNDEIAIRLKALSAEMRSTNSNSIENAKVLNISILQLVNETSEPASSITVDIKLISIIDTSNSPMYGHLKVNETDYPSYAACWMGHLLGSGMNTTLASEAQEACFGN